MTTIKIGDQLCEMIITPRVLNVWMLKHKIGFEQMATMTMDQQSDLIWLGVERGCRDSGVDVTREQFDDVMDSEQGFQIMGVFQKYMEQLMAKMTGDDSPDEDSETGN